MLVTVNKANHMTKKTSSKTVTQLFSVVSEDTYHMHLQQQYIKCTKKASTDLSKNTEKKKNKTGSCKIFCVTRKGNNNILTLTEKE